MNRYHLKAPTIINLEITEACNMKCRHCYNYWRDRSKKYCFMNSASLEKLFDMFVEAGIFHVVFTGGEPFLNFNLLEFGIRKAIANNISVSCNSNLILASDDKIKRLRAAGLDHILTSLNSHKPEINDYLVNQKGAFQKIVQGIQVAIKGGMRVSVNMIVSQYNKKHVYETGKMAHALGCQKIFGTRMVPSMANGFDIEKTALNQEDARQVVEQLIQIKKDTGILIGTLVSYPLCLLGDLEKYVDFVGRGCPAQTGHFMSINANGDTHVCVHQAESCGNVFVQGLYKSYQNMYDWHHKNCRYKGCDGCDYIDICRTGCRMSAHICSGRYDGKDPLMTNQSDINKSYQIFRNRSIYDLMDAGLKFMVPNRLRFRKEKDFYLVNIRWANTISVSEEVGCFLVKYYQNGKSFDINDFGCFRKKLLAELLFKDVVISHQVSYNDRRDKAGFGVDIADLK